MLGDVPLFVPVRGRREVKRLDRRCGVREVTQGLVDVLPEEAEAEDSRGAGTVGGIRRWRGNVCPGRTDGRRFSSEAILEQCRYCHREAGAIVPHTKEDRGEDSQTTIQGDIKRFVSILPPSSQILGHREANYAA